MLYEESGEPVFGVPKKEKGLSKFGKVKARTDKQNGWVPPAPEEIISVSDNGENNSSLPTTDRRIEEGQKDDLARNNKSEEESRKLQNIAREKVLFFLKKIIATEAKERSIDISENLGISNMAKKLVDDYGDNLVKKLAERLAENDKAVLDQEDFEILNSLAQTAVGDYAVNLKKTRGGRMPAEKGNDFLKEKKDHVDRAREAFFKEIDKLSNTASLGKNNQDEIRDILGKRLKFGKFKIRMDDFKIDRMESGEVEELTKYINSANEEIKIRIKDRRKDLEDFLRKIEAVKVETTEPVEPAKTAETVEVIGTAKPIEPEVGGAKPIIPDISKDEPAVDLEKKKITDRIQELELIVRKGEERFAKGHSIPKKKREDLKKSIKDAKAELIELRDKLGGAEAGPEEVKTPEAVIEPIDPINPGEAVEVAGEEKVGEVVKAAETVEIAEPVNRDLILEKSKNKIDEVKAAVAGLTAAEFLELSENFLVDLPEEIREDVKRSIIEEKKLAAGKREEISNLERAVAEARKDYAEVDYKKKKAYKRVYNFLGSIFRGKEEKNLEDDADVAYYRAIYENKLFDYKNLLLADAKARNVSNKELGEIVKLFDTEATVNLADSHTQTKIEHHEGKFSNYIKQRSLEMVQGYKNLSTTKKIAIAAAFGLVGWQASTLGAAAVGVAVSAAQVRRVFMGMVAGTGVAMALEARDAKKSRNNMEKEAESFVQGLEGLSAEEKYAKAFARIQELNDASDSKLGKFKNKNLINLSLGTAIGTIVGSGILSDAVKWVGNETGLTHWISEKIGLGNQGGLLQAKPEVASSHVPPAGMAKNIELPIEKGSSLERTIINHLDASGVDHREAGRLAHRMALEYAKNHNIPFNNLNEIYPGQHIEISPDGTKLVNIAETFESKSLSEIRGVSLRNIENWRAMKNISIDQAKEKLSPKLVKSLLLNVEKYQTLLGDSGKPLKGEKVQAWLARVVKKAMQLKK